MCIELHSRRDVLFSSIADGVVPKSMWASPCPPPHTCTYRQHMYSPPPTCTPKQHFTKHAPPPQPKAYHATATRCTHTDTTHASLVRVVFRPTAVAMWRAPASPMELPIRLCARHHARHHTQTCITPSTHACTANRAHQHNTSPTTRLPHNLKHTTPRPRCTHTQTPRTQGSSESCSAPQPSRCAVLH